MKLVLDCENYKATLKTAWRSKNQAQLSSFTQKIPNEYITMNLSFMTEKDFS